MSDLPEGHEYRDYEIPYEAKLNLKEIERCLREGRYNSETMCREHIDLLENLEAEVSVAMENERKIGRYNATLKHDQERIRTLLKKLETKLTEFDNP